MFTHLQFRKSVTVKFLEFFKVWIYLETISWIWIKEQFPDNECNNNEKKERKKYTTSKKSVWKVLTLHPREYEEQEMLIWNRVFQEFFWTPFLFSDAYVPVMTHEP